MGRWTGALVVLALVGWVPPAPGASTSVVVSPIKIFLPAEVSITAGDSLQYANLDALGAAGDGLHDLTSTSRVPLFKSATVSPGNVVSVVGVETLAPGTYFFYCTQHDEMRGTLKVAAPTGGGQRG